MRIDAGQHLRMDQRMKLAPRMIQSMEILQLSSQALEERLEQELSANPTLELREPGTEPEEVEAEVEQEKRDTREGERELVVQDGETKTENQADDFERLGNMSEELGDSWEANAYETGEDGFRPSRAPSGERDAKMDAMANTAARGQCLADQLLDQWRMIELPTASAPELRLAGEYLIGLVDSDGYVRTEWQTVVQQAPQGVTEALLNDALKLLQQGLEPPGLMARDLRECLLLQIEARIRLAEAEGDDPPDLSREQQLVSEHLKDVEANRLPRIAAGMECSIDEVKKAIAGLRHFHPHPGRLLVEENPRTIRPDAVVEFDEATDRYTARLLNDWLPTVQLSHRYMKMVRDKRVDRKTREFVGNNLRAGKWLIEAIQQRANTLQRVINVVIEAQREFFDFGPQLLKPLPMTQVADQLGIHVATVSRAVSEKYLDTPRGVLPLRMFFSGGTETEAGEAVSWAAVQAKLKEIIDAEDKSNPLNDDELVVKLKAAGIDIARRTVAKYRKQLHIAPARQRKQY